MEFFKPFSEKVVEKAEIKVSGSKAAVGKNDIKMVGNPLASITREGQSNEPFFLYDPYFWGYNARVDGGSFNDFIARVPYQIHPWVNGIGKSLDGGRFTIQFSHPVKASCEDIQIDLKECLNSSDEKYFNTEVDVPTLSDDKMFMTFSLRDDIRFADFSKFTKEEIGDNWNGSYVEITVSKEIKSDPNDFPLMGNTASESFWYYDVDEDGVSEWMEGNSHQPPQKEGKVVIKFPCFKPEEG